MATATIEKTSEQIAAEKEAKFNEDWTHVMGGLDRAVEWVKANKQNLRKGFSFYLNRETGIEIHIGTIYDGDQEQKEALRRLFGGKSATRRVDRDGNESFTLRDAGLKFTWDFWHYRQETEKQTTEVTI